jgi:hypothetical protein
MERRDFLKSGATGVLAVAAAPARAAAQSVGDRAYLVSLACRMAEPVLGAMSQGRLQRVFPLEVSPTWDNRDRRVAYLECFGRLIAGIAPWLALPDDGSPEGLHRATLRSQVIESLAHSVDPASPDCLFWEPRAGQPLVDSAFYVSALMRAPEALWEPLDAATKTRIVAVVKGLRAVSPPYSNWLLFAAMNEAFLLSVGEAFDPVRLNLAVRKLNEWYAGDGWFRDGETFAFDYYNSYVIHPMLLEILEAMVRYGAPFAGADSARLLAQHVKRSQRYSEHLERLISPSGTYPPVGRSITYRSAAFQPLAQLAWKKLLPVSLPEGQVRAAMAAMHRTVFDPPGNFTRDGFLTMGLAGPQPALGDSYSNNGSVYIAAASLLPLGLPAGDSYWTAPPVAWTQKRAFSNAPFSKDYRVDY